MKQETLEEALDNYIAKKHTQEECIAFIEGFQLSKQQGYSEEEVEEIVAKLMHEVHNGDITYGDHVIDFKLSPRQWFEQIKKK